jgi:hypothetical protein
MAPKRFSVQCKMAVVVRLLRGEPLELGPIDPSGPGPLPGVGSAQIQSSLDQHRCYAILGSPLWRLTRRTVPIMFSMMLVQASERRSSATQPAHRRDLI